ncbi:MAG: MFS transporter [Firmicutes bacterium]|nr:MFS transporter [Bacillota bacterium]
MSDYPPEQSSAGPGPDVPARVQPPGAAGAAAGGRNAYAPAPWLWRSAGWLTQQLGVGDASDMPRLIWILALGGFISSIGSAFVWPLNTIYIHFVLGKPLALAGLALMLQAGLSVVGQIAGGILHDRFGGKGVILAGLGLSASMLTVIGLVRIWPVYLCAMAALGFSYGLIDPATSGLVARAWPGGGRRGFNFLYVARNAGVAIGTAIGGLLAQVSFTLAFLSNATIALIYGWMVLRWVPWRIPRTEPQGTAQPVASAAGDCPQEEGAARAPAQAAQAVIANPGPSGPGKEPPASHRLAWVALGLVSVAVALVWLSYSQWQAVVSVYMQTLGYSLAAYSVLWTINGVQIVVGQPLVTTAVRRRLHSLPRQLTAGGLLFTAAFVLIWLWPQYAGFVVGMVILTFGEMLVLPALPAVAAELAPSHQQGRFQGILGGAGSVGRMFGPVAGGTLYDRWSPPGVLAAAGLVCLTATAVFTLYGLLFRRVRSSRDS